jgi:hypothetical protein
VRGNLDGVDISFSNRIKLVAKYNMCSYSKVRVDISVGISIYDWFYIRWLLPAMYFWNEINVYRTLPIQNNVKQ